MTEEEKRFYSHYDPEYYAEVRKKSNKMIMGFIGVVGTSVITALIAAIIYYFKNI